MTRSEKILEEFLNTGTHEEQMAELKRREKIYLYLWGGIGIATLAALFFGASAADALFWGILGMGIAAGCAAMTNSTWQYLDTKDEDAVSRKDIRCYRLMGGYLIPKLLGYICSKQTRLYLLLVLWRI